MRGIATNDFAVGEDSFTHSNNEVISVNDLTLAAKVYATFAVNTCGVMER